MGIGMRELIIILLVATALRPSLVGQNPLLFATVVVITVVLLGVAGLRNTAAT